MVENLFDTGGGGKKTRKKKEECKLKLKLKQRASRIETEGKVFEEC